MPTMRPYQWMIFLAMGALLFAQPDLEVINVKNVGAIGDGWHDDTKAIQQAMEEASRSGRKVFLPTGTYLVGALNIPSCTQVYGTGSDSVLQAKSAPTEKERPRWILGVQADGSGSPDPSKNITNVVLSNFRIEGTSPTEGFQEHTHLLNFNGLSDSRIEHLTISGFRGDGIYLGSGNSPNMERHNQRIQILDCTFLGKGHQNRNAITIIDGDSVLIRDCRFQDCTRPGMPGPIDLEPNHQGAAFVVLRSITVQRCEFRTCFGNAAIGVYEATPFKHPIQNIDISENHMDQTNAFVAGAIWITTGENPSTVSPMGLVIRDNLIQTPPRNPSIQLVNVCGALILNNQIESSGPVILGRPNRTDPSTQEIRFRGNTQRGGGSTLGMLLLGPGRDIDLTNNQFLEPDTSPAAILLQASQPGSGIESLTIGKNIYQKGRSQTHAIKISRPDLSFKKLKMIPDSLLPEGLVNQLVQK